MALSHSSAALSWSTLPHVADIRSVTSGPHALEVATLVSTRQTGEVEAFPRVLEKLLARRCRMRPCSRAGLILGVIRASVSVPRHAQDIAFGGLLGFGSLTDFDALLAPPHASVYLTAKAIRLVLLHRMRWRPKRDHCDGSYRARVADGPGAYFFLNVGPESVGVLVVQVRAEREHLYAALQ